MRTISRPPAVLPAGKCQSKASSWIVMAET
jgi:hypothetical protein